MDTSNPSRPRGKGAGTKAGAVHGVLGPSGRAVGKPSASQAFWVSLGAREDAPLFTEAKGGKNAKEGEALLTDAGRLVAECWRALGEGRPSLVTDAFSVGPRSFQGILRLKPGPGALTLPAVLRLFKALSARALARALAGNTSATSRPAALWKRGYAERPLATLKQVVEARASLKAAMKSGE